MNTPPSTPLSQNSYGELQRKTNGRMASCKTTSVHFHSFREWSATSPPSPLPATLPVSLSPSLSWKIDRIEHWPVDNRCWGEMDRLIRVASAASAASSLWSCHQSRPTFSLQLSLNRSTQLMEISGQCFMALFGRVSRCRRQVAGDLGPAWRHQFPLRIGAFTSDRKRNGFLFSFPPGWICFRFMLFSRCCCVSNGGSARRMFERWLAAGLNGSR